MDRSRALAPMYVFYGALSVVFCSPLLSRPDGLGRSDWDQHLFYYAQVLKNVVEYAQPPYWSPWYCGGNVMWQNPQVAVLSPAYPLSAIASLALAMKLNIILHYWVGFVGMHLLLTRVVGLSSLPVVVYLASVFTLSGAEVLHLSVGHSVFLPAFYLPLQLFWFFRALTTGAVRFLLMAAALLALMVYNGGTHIVPIALIGIGAFSVWAAIAQRSWRPVVLSLLLGIAGGAYAAPKLLPVTRFVASERFWDTRNAIEHPDRMTAGMMLRAYADPFQSNASRFSPLQRHSWWEYGNYIGLLAVVLIPASLVWALASRRTPEPPDGPGATRENARWFAVALALTALLFLALSAGELGALAPASIARRLPFFGDFRIPSRYTIGFVLFGALTAGVFVRMLIQPLERSSPEGPRYMRATRALASTANGNVIVAAVCAIGLVDVGWVNSAQLRGVFPLAPLDGGFHALRGSGTLVTDSELSPYTDNAPMLRSLMHDRAVFYCYESLQLTRAAIPDIPLIASDGHAQISSVVFTPNRVQFSAIGGQEPSRIFLNQNMADGWTSNAGPVSFVKPSGRPYVTLAAGQAGKFWFAFSPPGLWIGVALAAVAAAFSALAWRRTLGQLG